MASRTLASHMSGLSIAAAKENVSPNSKVRALLVALHHRPRAIALTHTLSLIHI